MKYTYIILLAVVLTCSSLVGSAQDITCEQSVDESLPNYCYPVPLDENVIYIVVASILVGWYSIYKGQRRLLSLKNK